jgi:hypothetical protein
MTDEKDGLVHDFKSPRKAHIIDYRIHVKFIQDGITGVMNGEGVDFIKDEPAAIIRHKHMRLFTGLSGVIGDYIRNNKV